jgi:hypothetical protein
VKDRSLLVLLAVTVAFVLYVKPARQNIDLLQSKIAVLDSQIASQENIKRQRKGIDGHLKSTGAAAAANESYLYPAAKSNSLALVDLQQFVKGAATASHMEVVTSTWGEPAPDPGTGLIKIPMTFTMKGLPANLDQFLKRLCYGSSRYIKTERATISKFQDQMLLLNISLVAFKRDAKP